MQYPNRELSQFASFLTINDFDKNIGITSNTLINIGIGTTVPEAKLHVNGNIKANGIVSANQYYGDGSTLSNVTAIVVGAFVANSLGIWTGSSIGIGTTNITEKLTVRGNVGVSSIVSAYRVSITAPDGVAPFIISSTDLVQNLNADYIRGRTPPNGNFVGDTDAQSLTNKTLINPIISTIVNGSANLGVPITSGTLIHTGAVGIITSGLYASGSINNSHISNSAAIAYGKLNLTGSIVNADISIGAAVSYSKLNLANSIVWSDFEPTIRTALQNATSGPQTFATLTRGSYLTGDNYNGTSATTWAVDASVNSVAGKIVARDASGNINANSFIGKGAIPVGGIINFSGNIANLPSEWKICNGENGTPDLRDRFIVGSGNLYNPGATGGSRNAVVVEHGHNAAASQAADHAHWMFFTDSSSSTLESTSPYASRTRGTNNDSAYIISGTPFSPNVGATSPAGAHSHTIAIGAAGVSGTNANMPPYYALAYIMRIA
jgi:microcystin-dependent protein